MNTFRILISTVILLTFVASSIEAQESYSLNIGEDGLNFRADTFSEYYNIPPERVYGLREQNIPDREWPYLFEIARAAGIDIDRVISARRQHPSLYDLLSLFNLSPSFLYLDYDDYERLGPPYGKAYGYFRNHPSEAVRWSDNDLINLAAVKFIHQSSRKPLAEVLRIYERSPRIVISDIDKVHKVRVKEKGSTKIKNKKNEHAKNKSKGKNKGNGGKGNKGKNKGKSKHKK